MLGEANIDRAPDRRTARRDATKAEIVAAAWELVREHGLAALSLRDLAARVGMRAPSIYQYFPSKHAIYDAMFGQAAAEALAQIPPPARANESARAAFRKAARSFFDFATSDPARAQLLFQRTIPGFEPSPESYAPALELLAVTRARLEMYGVTDPEAQDMWTAMVSGLSNQQLANDPGGDRWGRLIDRVVDAFLYAVGPTNDKQ
jgi:AcrR family transcriptional regulator